MERSKTVDYTKKCIKKLRNDSSTELRLKKRSLGYELNRLLSLDEIQKKLGVTHKVIEDYLTNEQAGGQIWYSSAVHCCINRMYS